METPMLDFSAPAIQNLIEQRSWHLLGEFERISCDSKWDLRYQSVQNGSEQIKEM